MSYLKPFVSIVIILQVLDISISINKITTGIIL